MNQFPCAVVNTIVIDEAENVHGSERDYGNVWVLLMAFSLIGGIPMAKS
jgi:hypothetical protein